jgi:hypothetical protein
MSCLVQQFRSGDIITCLIDSQFYSTDVTVLYGQFHGPAAACGGAVSRTLSFQPYAFYWHVPEYSHQVNLREKPVRQRNTLIIAVNRTEVSSKVVFSVL